MFSQSQLLVAQMRSEMAIAHLALIQAAKYSGIDFTPPQGVQDAARRGLELRKEHGRGGMSAQEASKEGIGSGVARATTLANGKAVSPSTIPRMAAFFSRHQKNFVAPKAGEKPSNGWISYLLWGGAPGEAWANKVFKQMQAADEKAS
jgi:hypothetical protein